MILVILKNHDFTIKNARYKITNCTGNSDKFTKLYIAQMSYIQWRPGKSNQLGEIMNQSVKKTIVFDCRDCNFRTNNMALATNHYTHPKTNGHRLQIITVPQREQGMAYA